MDIWTVVQRPQPGDGVHRLRRATRRHQAAQLSFNPQGTLRPNTLYNAADPSKSNVGTITINFPHGGSYDLVATNSIRSGKIAALSRTARQHPGAGASADRPVLRRRMASALSDKTTAGTAAPASAAPQAGYDLDLAGMQSGNVIHHHLQGQHLRASQQQSVDHARRRSERRCRSGNTATLDPNDEVLGIDFSGGMGSVHRPAQCRARPRRRNLSFSNPSARRCACWTTARRTARTSSRRR